MALLLLLAGSFTVTAILSDFNDNQHLLRILQNTATVDEQLRAARELAIAALNRPVESIDHSTNGHFEGVLGNRTQICIIDRSSRPSLKNVNPEALVASLRKAGTSEDAAIKSSDRILDWMDSDSETRNDGAEKRQYRQTNQLHLPPNRPIHQLSELRLISGVTSAAIMAVESNFSLQTPHSFLPTTVSISENPAEANEPECQSIETQKTNLKAFEGRIMEVVVRVGSGRRTVEQTTLVRFTGNPYRPAHVLATSRVRDVQ